MSQAFPPHAFPPQAFPALGSEYEPFLYAVLCDEANGMPLTMISAIARSGADPWAEAARLAKLPKNLAIEALARMIPDCGAESAAIANRLFALLPTAGGAKILAFPGAIKNAPRWNPLVPLIIALFLGLALVSVFKPAPAPNDGQASPAASAPANRSEP